MTVKLPTSARGLASSRATISADICTFRSSSVPASDSRMCRGSCAWISAAGLARHRDRRCRWGRGSRSRHRRAMGAVHVSSQRVPRVRCVPRPPPPASPPRRRARRHRLPRRSPQPGGAGPARGRRRGHRRTAGRAAAHRAGRTAATVIPAGAAPTCTSGSATRARASTAGGDSATGDLAGAHAPRGAEPEAGLHTVRARSARRRESDDEPGYASTGAPAVRRRHHRPERPGQYLPRVRAVVGAAAGRAGTAYGMESSWCCGARAKGAAVRGGPWARRLPAAGPHHRPGGLDAPLRQRPALADRFAAAVRSPRRH